MRQCYRPQSRAAPVPRARAQEDPGGPPVVRPRAQSHAGDALEARGKDGALARALEVAAGGLVPPRPAAAVGSGPVRSATRQRALAGNRARPAQPAWSVEFEHPSDGLLHSLKARARTARVWAVRIR